MKTILLALLLALPSLASAKTVSAFSRVQTALDKRVQKADWSVKISRMQPGKKSRSFVAYSVNKIKLSDGRVVTLGGKRVTGTVSKKGMVRINQKSILEMR